MNIQWDDLAAAFALYLVMEGMVPFAFPKSARHGFVRLARMPSRSLRIMGLMSMVAGLMLLYSVRQAHG